ncbi:unnamed protein product [Dimorphilus gyrociliatus]|uniref:G-protein coupled receptors family 1 profile domain-containing protein n=1 Tax=Dimorphilus gyrociliatus TaxID=2664684 RepID=A0A7I8W9U9_9ANNE|nr:unnamed protein product [Dimorphilus gyrociliatus]
MMSTIFLINQSLIDTATSVLLGISYWTEKLIDERTMHGSLLKWYCHGWNGHVTVWGVLIGSSYNLVLLSLERYFSVMYPVAHKNLSRRKAIIAATLVWIVFICYQYAHQSGTTVVLSTGLCRSFSNWPNDLTRRAVGILIVVIQFIIPLVIIAFSYISLAISFSKKSASVAPSQHAQDMPQRVRKNSIKTFAIVACAFVICWIFNQTYFLGFYFGLVSSLTGYYYHFSKFMVFVNCFINPFIYTFRYGEFKKELRKYRLFKQCFKVSNEISTSGENSAEEKDTKESKF